MKDTVLVVDDEKEICDLIAVYLKNEGYRVLKFYKGAEALECLDCETVDLAILDIMLPDIDGYSLLRKIREKHLFPIIMLTAKCEDIDKINGLTLGADDYMTKPFNSLEVVTRVKTQLRRYKKYNLPGLNSDDEINIMGLTISKKSHQCFLNSEKLNLTPREFDILYYLCERKGQVVSNDELFKTVWNEKYFEAGNNTIMSHIARIREKMHETARKPKYIKTVWGVGYKID